MHSRNPQYTPSAGETDRLHGIGRPGAAVEFNRASKRCKLDVGERMIAWDSNHANREALYRGLRMSADEYLALEDDGHRYELIDGVVCISPSPSPLHSEILLLIAFEIGAYLRSNPIGKVFNDQGVPLKSVRHGDIVYQPDIVFLSADKADRIGNHIADLPDLVVEIVSPSSRRMDNETKRGDYENAGIGEYWIIDPLQKTMTFLRLRDGKYEDVATAGDRFESAAIPGFSLDLARVRAAFPAQTE